MLFGQRRSLRRRRGRGYERNVLRAMSSSFTVRPSARSWSIMTDIERAFQVTTALVNTFRLPAPVSPGDTGNTPRRTTGLACWRKTPRRDGQETSSGLAGSRRLIWREGLPAGPGTSPDRPRPTMPPKRSAVVEDVKATRTAAVAARTAAKECTQADCEPAESDHFSEVDHDHRRDTTRKTIR
jgi:hypothetical protein